MKIGIVTFTSGTNLGQRLQNYALQTVIEDLGNEAYTIRQRLSRQSTKRVIVENIKLLTHPFKFYKSVYRKIKFLKFNKQHIKFYKKIISFYNPSNKLKKDFDKFITGSDQVWNPNSSDVGGNYFLNFSYREQRIAYAPSLSVDTLPLEVSELYKEYFNGFDKISVREYQGKEIVESLVDKKADVVLDPTLLLNIDDWERIKKKSSIKHEENFILSLFLGEVPKKDVSDIANNVNLSVVSIDNYSTINPSEFIDLISSARLVLTDSYHVIVFSNIYHIPYINFLRNGDGQGMNSRFKTLYDTLQLPNRVWDSNSSSKRNLSLLEMDFDVFEQRKAIEKEKSLKYLIACLGK